MHMEADSQPQVSLLGSAESLSENWREFQDSTKLAIQVYKNLYISAPLPTSPQSNRWCVPLWLDFMRANHYFLVKFSSHLSPFPPLW